MILAVVGMEREAQIVARPGVVPVVGGGRADLLEQRLKAALPGAEAILSIGVCGALDPALEVGEVVIGSEVLRPRGRWETDAEFTAFLKARLPQAKVGPVYGANEMVLNALDKAKLRSNGGADAVDMESHVAARVAASRKLPFGVLRVVSDTAATSLPEAVREGLNEDGSQNLKGVLMALLRNPGQLPALIRVGREVEAAFKALKEAADRALKV